jgi:hypothetical protein
MTTLTKITWPDLNKLLARHDLAVSNYARPLKGNQFTSFLKQIGFTGPLPKLGCMVQVATILLYNQEPFENESGLWLRNDSGLYSLQEI